MEVSKELNMKIPYAFVLLLALVLASCNGPSSKSKGTLALIETNKGSIKIKLYDSTPKHKENFIKLVKQGYYNDLLFHRVIQGFMMQGGDPQSKNAGPGVMLGNGGPGYTIPAEIGGKHFKGALAAARLGDAVNPAKESSGSQFYIVQGRPVNRAEITMMSRGKNLQYTEEETKKYETLGGTPFLDGDYTVFGEVVEGMEVIDAICMQPCDQGNRPTTNITMKIRML